MPRQPSQSSYPPPAPTGKTAGDRLFWLAVAVLFVIAVLLVGAVLWERWETVTAEPTEIVFTAGMVEITLQPTQDSLILPESQPTPRLELGEPAPIVTPGPSVQVEPTNNSAAPMPSQERTGSSLRDDFSTSLLGWSEVAREGSQRGYAREAYFVTVSQPGVYALSFLPAEFNPEKISFTAQLDSISTDGTFGLLCQYQNEANFVLIEINATRAEFTLGVRREGEYQALLSPEWQPLANFRSEAGVWNTLDVVCLINRVQLNVNGVPAGEATLAPDVLSGTRAALFAASRADLGEVNLLVWFDDLVASGVPLEPGLEQ
jgi:hypothetical protein